MTTLRLMTFAGLKKTRSARSSFLHGWPPPSTMSSPCTSIRYERTAWRLGETDPFHHQLGYWLWDPSLKQVIHSFMIPRGVTVLAGGEAQPDSKVISVHAKVGLADFRYLLKPVFG